jgi:hypothetical protein
MNLSTFDFIIINSLSYLLGIGSGLLICCKYKNKFMSRSFSSDNLKQYNHHQSPIIPVIPSAPTIAEITLK